MNHRIFYTLLAVGCLFGACKDFDFDDRYGVHEDTKKQADYTANWNKNFGRIDATQDWNCVRQVNATVTFSEFDDLTGNTIKIYNSDPYRQDSKLLAQFAASGTTMQFAFDALKSYSFVYVVREKPDGFRAALVADIENNSCQVSFDTMPADDVASAPMAKVVAFWDKEVPEGQYPDRIPETIKDITPGRYDEINQNNTTYGMPLHLHGSEIRKINFWSGGLDIYFSNDVTIDEWYCGGNSKLYVMPGATVTLKDDTDKANPLLSFGQWNTTITVCPGGKLILPGGVEFAGNTQVYNAGIIDAARAIGSNSSVFYNENAMNVSGEWRLTNGSTVFVNSGNVTADETTVEGASSFYNTPSGNVTIAKTVAISSNTAIWYNMGHYYCQDMNVTAASDNWYNACYLKVSGTMSLIPGAGAGAFRNYSYIECANYVQDVAHMELSADSQLRVTGTATFIYNCYKHQGNGLISTALGGEWAVFQAKKIVFGDNSQHGSISYVGNLIVDSDDYPERYSDDGGHNYNWTLYEGAKIAKGGDGYEIEGTECRDPYNPVVPPTPVDEPISYIIACEDLGSTEDTDFNDVVIRISHVAGLTTATITPLAAGGELKSDVYFRYNLLGEIHNLIDGTSGAAPMPMLNTGYNGQNPGKGKAIEVKVEADYTLSYNSDNTHDFMIVTHQKNTSGSGSSILITRPTMGTAPQIILLPGDWKWPTERVQIADAYPEFKGWSQDAETHVNWFKSPAPNASIMSFD